MYCIEFIFEPGTYDEEFHTLDDLIQELAESMDGYLGKEVWQSADGVKINSSYYWENEEVLHAFSKHPRHLEAKRQYTKWYKGYHIVVSKVVRSYGDGAITHVTPNERAK